MAQTQDGFIDKERVDGETPQPTPISNDFTRMLVHKKRAEVAGIMIGTTTAVNDNPSLTTRFWYGNNPVRIVIDRQGRIPADYQIFDGKVETIVFTATKIYEKEIKGVIFKQVVFDDTLFEQLFEILKKKHINALMVEGGAMLLQSLIDKQMWDEAYIETAATCFGRGTKSPHIQGRVVSKHLSRASELLHLSIR